MHIGLLIIIILTILTVHFNSSYNRAITTTSKENLQHRYINISILVLIVITGLRNVAVGPDTYGYYCDFMAAQEMSWSDLLKALITYYTEGIGKDQGYPLFEKIIGTICGGSFRIFLFVIAILFYSGFSYILKSFTKTIDEAFVALLIFTAIFLIYAFSALRQDIALCCTIFSMKFIKDRRLTPFLLLVFLGSTVHRSALLFIPYYWIARFKNVRLMSVAIVAILPIMYALARPLALFMVANSGTDAYDHYITDGIEGGTPTFTILLLVCFVFYLYMQPHLNRFIPGHQIFTNTIFFTVGLSPVTWVEPNFMRVLLYFSIFLPVIVADCISLIPNTPTRRFCRMICVFTIAFFILKTTPPYEFFWNHMPLGANYRYHINTSGI